MKLIHSLVYTFYLDKCVKWVHHYVRLKLTDIIVRKFVSLRCEFRKNSQMFYIF